MIESVELTLDQLLKIPVPQILICKMRLRILSTYRCREDEELGPFASLVWCWEHRKYTVTGTVVMVTGITSIP